MSEIGSELAYPHNEMTAGGDHWQSHAGLTKREHFAALAMQGLLASPQKIANAGHGGPTADQFAELAVAMADATLAALKE